MVIAATGAPPVDPALESRAHQLVRAGDLSGACRRVGRNAAPAFLNLWREQGLVTDAMLRAELLDVWQLVEFPCRALPRRRWLEWFSVTGFLSDTDTPRPSAPIDVYRAQVGRTWGLSWTIDRDRAKWFVERNHRLGFGGGLLCGCAPPVAMLATIRGSRSRNEGEIILDPLVMRRSGRVRSRD